MVKALPASIMGRVLCAIKSLKNGLPQYFAQYFLETSTSTKKKKSPKTLYFQGFSMELMAGFEPATSSLPRMRSTY